MAIGLFGALLQITTLRPLIGRDPLTTIIATFGISLVLQKYALWQFGPTAQNIPQPISGRFELFYLQYPWYRLGAAVMAGAIIGALYLFLKRSGADVRYHVPKRIEDGYGLRSDVVEKYRERPFDFSDSSRASTTQCHEVTGAMPPRQMADAMRSKKRRDTLPPSFCSIT